MKSYDYDYFQGKDLRYPAKPSKPMLTRNPTAAEARAYADGLEDYERELNSYKEDRDWYTSEIHLRSQALQDRIRADHDISQAQFDLLWSKAVARDSGSLEEAVAEFEELYELAAQFAALEK